ncbi:MAG: LysR family transcriptional regulator [Enterocloster sp.]
MNFDNYRYFAAAAEELNFTKAARKLFMTQQALSKQIDKMEKEYNTRLFNRETPMSLTPAGECMYRHVCRIWTMSGRCGQSWTRFWGRKAGIWWWASPISAAAS